MITSHTASSTQLSAATKTSSGIKLWSLWSYSAGRRVDRYELLGSHSDGSGEQSTELPRDDMFECDGSSTGCGTSTQNANRGKFAQLQ